MEGRAADRRCTLVDPELRDSMRTLCQKAELRLLRTCSATNRSNWRRCQDSSEDGALAPAALDEAYFRRHRGVEYAVADDGVGRALGGADVVLVGVSRTSKTPVSMYLGYLGYKAANVPIVQGIEPAAELLRGRARRKVIGFTIDAQRLAKIRGRADPADGRRPQATQASTRSTRSSYARRIAARLPVME